MLTDPPFAVPCAAGTQRLVRAPESERRAGGVFEPQAPAIAAIAARFKAAFDPDERLNPGRMS
ncbi:MAG: hypothetical protein WDM77_21010 [Steroidobacteraceae bacterium]